MVQWYHTENGKQVGPVSELDLGSLIAAGKVESATLIWSEGMTEWLPLSQVSAQGGLEVLPPSMGYDLLQSGKKSGWATASLFFGIAGLVSCMVFLGIPAVICGHMAMHQIENSRNMITGRSAARGGLLYGYLCLLIMFSFLVVIIFVMVTSKELR